MQVNWDSICEEELDGVTHARVWIRHYDLDGFQRVRVWCPGFLHTPHGCLFQDIEAAQGVVFDTVWWMREPVGPSVGWSASRMKRQQEYILRTVTAAVEVIRKG